MSRSFLDKIRPRKLEEVEQRRGRTPLPELKAGVRDLPPTRDFTGALASSKITVIAEIKRASPSAGAISSETDPAARARLYREGGAGAVSVLTESAFFAGELGDLKLVREAIELPVLRKDFILDPYQVWEARTAGADAVLLIAEFVAAKKLRELLELSHSLGLDALVEAHGAEGLDRALAAGARIVGINNRDLVSLRVDPGTAQKLLPLVPPDRLRVAESGMSTATQVEAARQAGADAVLVGEALMRAGDPVRALRRLRGEEP